MQYGNTRYCGEVEEENAISTICGCRLNRSYITVEKGRKSWYNKVSKAGGNYAYLHIHIKRKVWLG